MSAYLKMLPQIGIVLCMGMTLALPRVVAGCSICASLSPTLCDEIGAADFAVLAEYVATPVVDSDINDPDAYKSSFRIQKILKGEQGINEDDSARVLFFPGESANAGDRYLMHGNWIEGDDQNEMVIRWTTPIAMTDQAIDYLHRMWRLPKEDVQRLIEAMPYLESDDPMLRRDVFDEFGKAPYELLEKLKPELDKNVLMGKIQDSRTEPNIRKLYYTLLTICGTPEELPFLKSQINEEQVNASESLPAIIACYLSLAGAQGLPFIEQTYLMQEGSDYERRAGSAITALRFHGQEASVIDRQEIADVFLRMLQRPTLGARVLSDLARWKNWSALDQAAEMFSNAEGDGLWVREPAIRYLLACPTEVAEKHVENLEKIDPLAVRNGRRFALPPTMASKTNRVKNKNLESPSRALQTGKGVEGPSRDAQDLGIDSGIIDKKAEAEDLIQIEQQIERGRYGLPLAIGVIFVLLLGWLLTRRGPRSI